MKTLHSLSIFILVNYSIASYGIEDQFPVFKSSIDNLNCGSVRTGSIVELSLSCSFSGNSASGLPIRIIPPPFISITGLDMSVENYNDRGSKIHYGISLAVNTEKSGEFNKPLHVQIADRAIDIPISVSINDRKNNEPRILVVPSPFNRYSGSSANIFATWIDFVKSTSLNCSYIEKNKGDGVFRYIDLSQFDVLVITGRSLDAASDSDVKKAAEFAANGGRVVVGAQYFNMGSAKSVNRFLAPNGMACHCTHFSFVSCRYSKEGRRRIKNGVAVL